MRLWFLSLFLIATLPLTSAAQPVEEPDTDIPGQSEVEQPKNPPPVEALVAAQPSKKPEKVSAKPGKEKTGDKAKAAKEAPKPVPFNAVVLQGLNKVTARAETIEAVLGSSVRFGTIEIVAHRCWQSAPDERPENAALLEISEVRQNEPPQTIFTGWMFSSSPGLSSLENPYYDVTVIRCERTAKKE